MLKKALKTYAIYCIGFWAGYASKKYVEQYIAMTRQFEEHMSAKLEQRLTNDRWDSWGDARKSYEDYLKSINN